MINPSEISDILKQQLSDIQSKVSFEEVGTVLEVGDGVAHVYGLENVEANELVEFENGVTGVAMNLEESNVGVILMDKVDSVAEGMKVRRTGEIASIHHHTRHEPEPGIPVWLGQDLRDGGHGQVRGHLLAQRW